MTLFRSVLVEASDVSNSFPRQPLGNMRASPVPTGRPPIDDPTSRGLKCLTNVL